MLEKSSRRSILKKGGATIAGVGILSQTGSGATPTPRPEIIKGDRGKPIRQSQVRRAQERIHRRLSNRDDSPPEIALRQDPVPDDGELVGYGLAVENGAPIEVTKTVPDPTPLSELPVSNKPVQVQEPRRRRRSRGADPEQRRELAREKIRQHAAKQEERDRVNIAHSELDRFRKQHSEGR